MSHNIVLLHATPVAMQPINAAMNALWPQATGINLLDEGLSLERAKSKTLSEPLFERFVRFGIYASDMGADGILATCSAFGEALEHLNTLLPIPVLKPNDAMFSQAIKCGQRIGMLATFAPAIGGMEQEFREMAAKMNSRATLTTVCAEGAMEHLRQGDAQTHNEIVARYAGKLADCDVIMLAHFSTSRALEAVGAVSPIPVLAAPQAAVMEMKALITAQ
ncbi:aspartate/glutamate racemase family protein [Sodalis sp. RH21]|uniref:aspartate/glutamate racemase family protein n=1 Tax=unclassified Sodalis (in: enterobacteria) TaxID=2636512 RepID=UPI0039B49E64